MKKQTIDELTDNFHHYLRSIRRSDSTIRRYLIAWEKLKTYMALRKLKLYTPKIGDAFLVSEFGPYKFEKLPLNKKHFVSKIEALLDFQKTGKVILGMRRKPPKQFSGAVGKTMQDFIDFRERLYDLSPITRINYEIYLHALLCFFNSKGIRSVKGTTQERLLQFISQLDASKPAARHVAINIVRNYARYLYENGQVGKDYSSTIPSDNYRQQAQLPSTFSKEEIEGFLSAIDRGNPKGKRDYAMFLLALKLGFRSSDVANLKFENISWSTNEFIFEQKKTKKPINLPILPEVGNALIDYLKYGRAQSSEKHCFLQVVYPYNKLSPHDIANAVQFYLKRSGIDLRNRKHGPHALRHSFASQLLQQGTSLPVISEALGHTTSMSTMFYLRIDASALMRCALDVPSIPFSFYQQKGGYHA